MPMIDDIQQSEQWIIQCFATERLKLDGSIDSLRHIDTFFERYTEAGQPKANSPLDGNLGSICFAVGAYLGQALIRAKPGKWNVDEDDEINVEVEFDDGSKCWPVQRVMKRVKNGFEDSVYPYACILTDHEPKAKKPWWRMWGS